MVDARELGIKKVKRLGDILNSCDYIGFRSEYGNGLYNCLLPQYNMANNTNKNCEDIACSLAGIFCKVESKAVKIIERYNLTEDDLGEYYSKFKLDIAQE